jgi:hypothetical protein
VSRIAWIKRQRAKFATQPRQSSGANVSGESHYFLGQRFRLRLIERAPITKVYIRNRRCLELHVRGIDDKDERERVLLGWYRRELKTRAMPVVEQWATAMELPATRQATDSPHYVETHPKFVRDTFGRSLSCSYRPTA